MKKFLTGFSTLMMMLLLTSCSAMIKTFAGLTDCFTVEFYADGTESNEIDYNTQIKPRVFVENANPNEYSAPEIPGFAYSEKNLVKIDEGNFVLQVCYARIPINFDIHGENWEDCNATWKEGDAENPIRTYKFGGKVPTKDDINFEDSYDFAGWKDADNVDFSLKDFGNTAANFTAQWQKAELKNDEAFYKVQYYLEDASKEEGDPERWQKGKSYTKKGKVGDITAIEKPADKAGYETPKVNNTKIKQNGSGDETETEVRIEYERASVTYTFKPNGGNWNDNSTEDKTVKGKIGSALSFTEKPTLLDSAFDKWNPALPKNFGDVEATFAAEWKTGKASYTIKYLYEDASKPENDAARWKNLTTKTESGNFGSMTDVQVNESDKRAGYLPPVFTNQIIKEDGSTVVEVKFERASVTYNFNANGGSWTEGKELITTQHKSGKIGSSVSIENPTQTDYAFKGWDPALSKTFGEANADFTATWQKENAIYTVKYLFEDASKPENDAAHWAEKTDKPSITQKGKIGTTTNVTATNEAGYDAPTIVQQTIKQDDTTVVEVKYPRSSVTYTFSLGDPIAGGSSVGAAWAGGGTADKTFSGKIGSAFSFTETNPICSVTTKKFGGYDKAIPKAFGATNETFTAQWIDKGQATYALQYYLEDASTSPSTWIEGSRITKSGQGGATVDSTLPESIAGYLTPTISDEEKAKTIAEDGSTVVRVEFLRASVTYTFSTDGGTWTSGGTANKTRTGKIGSALSFTESDPTREDYEFIKWNPSIPTNFGETDATITAQWKQVNANYTIKYYYEDASTSPTTWKEDQTKKQTAKGKIGTTTNVATPATEAGYKTPTVTQTTITQDGNAEVIVRFERASVTYTFDAADGTWTDDSTENKTATGKIGSAFSFTEKPTLKDKVFTSWGVISLPTSFGDTDQTFTATWADDTKGTPGPNIDVTKDITLRVSANGSTITASCTKPFGTGMWTFTWRIDRTENSKKTDSITERGMSDGEHTIVVVARELETGYSATKQATITVDHTNVQN